MIKPVLTLLLLFISVYNSTGKQYILPANKEEISKKATESEWINQQIETMSLKEKIGQFFMVGAYPSQGSSSKEAVKNLITKYNVGGVIFFKGSANDIAIWSNQFQEASKIPLFVSIDGEWGINMRVKEGIQWPRQLTLGAISDHNLIFKMGQHIAQECKLIGVNINLAPVLDINNNPNNPVINDRSFGEDKYNVAIKGLSYTQGMQSKGLMAVGKHFPGHGDTDTDSHHDLPIINKDYKVLKELELYPFQVAINNGIMGIMAAHLNIPPLDNTPNLASSLSKKIVHHLLRDSLHFDGLIFSDALNMKGANKYFSPGEVDVKAFMAGNDVLVVSEDIGKGVNAILSAVKKGIITEKEIDQRLYRVLKYKYTLNLSKNQKVSTSNINQNLHLEEAEKLNQTLFESAITLVKNQLEILPLQGRGNIASLALGSTKKQIFQNTLEHFGISEHYETTSKLSASQAASLANKLEKYNTIIVGVCNMSRWKSKNYGFSSGDIQLLKQLNNKANVILLLFGTPYSLVHFEDFNTIIVAYENNKYTQKAAAEMLFGKKLVQGKLPVSAGVFKSGEGLDLSKKFQLEHATPESQGMNPQVLDSIDYFAKKAIKNKATPGCAVIVVKNGSIVYDKGFGYSTYTSNQKVNTSTIYDLASITKVAATTLAIMKLYEENRIDINQNIGYYIDDYKGKEVGNISIKNILGHQSGLPAWIPFYTKTLKDDVYHAWYNKDSTETYNTKVAHKMYAHKDSVATIWSQIGNLSVRKNPTYKYSDIGFYLLYRIVEQITKIPFEEYLKLTFYKPMGLNSMGFNPYKRYDVSSVMPTENDEVFRKQTVQGTVHDPGAAMLGGVCGHAGLFSNAYDLAALFQMFLSDGTYNGLQFLKPETIEYFNSTPFIYNDKNRRALGFDKPMLIDKNTGKIERGGPTAINVSSKCFGHTGFTGTCVWADPKNNLVYVFLSNRTFPSAKYNKLSKMNTRTDIQRVIYNAII